jgi:3-oxoacyl-[acyl-carrier-protein] synthase II
VTPVAADRRRVAVTGVGVVAPCGIGREAFWRGLLEVPKDEIERRVTDFDPLQWLGPKDARRADRFAQFAVAAAELALADAGGVESLGDSEAGRRGVLIATGIGGIGTLEDQMNVMRDRGPRRVSPFTVPMIMSNAGSASVSMRLGWQGPSETITTACAAGTHGIAAGASWIRHGRCDVVLAGGAEAAVTPFGMASFTSMTAVSQTGISRPFDVERDGFVVAEGGAVLLLEEMGRALARGATVYAEVAGWGSNADAHHITAPSPGGVGAAACMREALADAGLASSDIAHVNAHGTSTPLNDPAEAAAIRTVFGDGVSVTSIKGVTGHSLGAAGAIEAASVVLSFEHGLLPPTAGLMTLDPAIEADIVATARPWSPAPTISNSFGFGGHNGSLVLLPV